MNSFIYEGYALEEKPGKTSFESKNQVTSSIGSNARKGKIFPIPRYKVLGVKIYMEVYKKKFLS